jgi:hypothetical protein
MTGRAAFNPGSSVFEKVRTAFVRVALQAGLLLEASQPFPRSRFMGIVTGNTSKYSFLQSVPFVQLEQRIDVFVTGQAAFGRTCVQKGRLGIGMDGVTRGAVHGCFTVNAGVEPRTGFCVACDTFLCFFVGRIFSFESKDVGSTPLIHVFIRITVAGSAALHGRMRVGGECLSQVVMALCAGFDVGFLMNWPGSGQKCGDTEGQSDEANRLEER